MSSPSVTVEVIDLLVKSKPSAFTTSSNPIALSTAYFGVEYTADEESSINEFVSAVSSEDAAAMALRLNSLLAAKTTLLGWKPSVADVSVWHLLAPLVAKWSPAERTGENGRHHVVRFVDFVQNSPIYGPLVAEKVSIDVNDVLVPIKPIDMKAEKERKKKEKEAAAAAAAAGGVAVAAPAAEKAVKKDAVVEDVAAKLEGTSVAETGDHKPEKKEKKKKEKRPAPPPPVERLLSPAMIDLRVGHILKAVCHPNADSLFVSTMDCGDAPGTDNTSFDEEFKKTVRTVCSGLNGLIPLEEMQNRQVVAVCNLKPVTMRGVKSCAMVLAASPRDADGHGGPVELVTIPEGAVAGDRVYFDGWEGEPEGVLNPKKKIWEAIQPGFTTTDNFEVGFNPSATESDIIQKQATEGSKSGLALLKTKAGLCKVKTLTNATVR